jgi:magnesium transporter
MNVFSNFESNVVYFSKILHTKIVGNDETYLGKFKDFFVDFENTYPLILAVLYQYKGHFYYVMWKDVEFFSYEKIQLKKQAVIKNGNVLPIIHKEKTQHKNEDNIILDYPSIAKVALDKQIVDTFGKKVVRVNDLHFIRVGEYLRVTYAAIGAKALLRRLGFDEWVIRIYQFLFPRSEFFKKEQLINWKFVHTIPNKNLQSDVQLKVANDFIKNIHPADFADLLEELAMHERESLFEQLDTETAAKILPEIDSDFQASLIGSMQPKEAAEILEEMGTDEACDILNELEQDRASVIISNIEDGSIQEELNELLKYKEDSAGGIMSKEILSVQVQATKNSIIEHIQHENENLASVYDIYIVDEKNKLIGSCTMRKLLLQKENIGIKDIMETEDLKLVHPDWNWKEVASYMSKYNLINLPVISKSGELVGVITVDDILPWTLDE